MDDGNIDEGEIVREVELQVGMFSREGEVTWLAKTWDAEVVG